MVKMEHLRFFAKDSLIAEGATLHVQTPKIKETNYQGQMTFKILERIFEIEYVDEDMNPKRTIEAVVVSAEVPGERSLPWSLTICDAHPGGITTSIRLDVNLRMFKAVLSKHHVTIQSLGEGFEKWHGNMQAYLNIGKSIAGQIKTQASKQVII